MTPQAFAALARIHRLANQAPARIGHAVHVTAMHSPEGYSFIEVCAFAPGEELPLPALALRAAFGPDGTELKHNGDLPLEDVAGQLAEWIDRQAQEVAA